MLDSPSFVTAGGFDAVFSNPTNWPWGALCCRTPTALQKWSASYKQSTRWMTILTAVMLGGALVVMACCVVASALTTICDFLQKTT